MLDRLFFISLVLNATGLFRFIAPPLGVSIGKVSLVLLIFNMFYLLARLSCLIPMFPKMVPWFVVLIVWPLATLAYAPTIDFREIGLAVYGFTLFAGAAVYTASNGLSAIRLVFLISLFLTVFGQVFNMVMPNHFEAVAALADARVLSMGRAGGFYMQPNALGISLAFIFIGWLALAERGSILIEPIVILVFLGCELLTGSRTGMVLGVVVVGLHLHYQWWERLFRSQKVRYLSTRLAVLVTIIIFGVIGVKSFIGSYDDQINRQSGDIIERMNTLLEFKLSDQDSLLLDTSLQERFGAQRVYRDLINKKPFFGHGFGAEVFYLESGDMHWSSHSTMLSAALEYGVVYPLIFFVLLMGTFLNRRRRAVERALGTNTVTQLVLVTLLMFVVGGGLFDQRVFFVVLGFVFTCLYYPWKVFDWDSLKRTYVSVLRKNKVRLVQRIWERISRSKVLDFPKTEVVV